MKKTTMLLLLFLAVHALSAQTLERQVIGISGAEMSNGDVMLSSTAGEPVIGTVSNGEQTLTQGFRQPDAKVSAPEAPVANLNVTVFPNPVTDQLQVQIRHNGDKTLYVNIVDMIGRQVSQRVAVNQQTAQWNHRFDTRQLADGMYFVSVSNGDGVPVQTFKITKIK